ncbi:MAG: hypothetical protein AB7P23_13865, partial [Amphiplicatus sp.]
FQRIGLQHAKRQEFSDMLALRGAREFLLANARPSERESMIRAISKSGLPDDLAMAPLDVSVRADAKEQAVTVTLTQPAQKSFVLPHMPPFSDEVSVASTAAARGGMNVCVIALEDRSANAIAAANDALLDATPCSVLSNSTSAGGVAARDSSKIKAGLICSAGGATGPSGNYEPSATTDCPPYEDPLAARIPPPVGPCDHFDFEAGYTKAQSANEKRGGVKGVVGGATDIVEDVAGIVKIPLIEVDIHPGVYCGGLKVKFNARAIFEPGIYVIKDGPLLIGKYSELRGRNIAFHLVGDKAAFTFDQDAKVTMSAPKEGPLAGILFFEDRDAPLDRVHAIYSEDAREFIGAFYLPRGILKVETRNPVADASAYTAIVVRKLALAGAPTLVLNANYSATDVPVPAGVGPVGGEVYIRN